MFKIKIPDDMEKIPDDKYSPYEPTHPSARMLDNEIYSY